MVTDKKREYNKQWYRDNMERVKKRQLQYRLDYPTINKSKYTKYKYGITFEQQKQMYISQNGVCAICGNKFENGRDIKIDHNHITKQVRGLLCQRCNIGIGHLRDDMSIVLKAAAYLNKWNSK